MNKETMIVLKKVKSACLWAAIRIDRRFNNRCQHAPERTIICSQGNIKYLARPNNNLIYYDNGNERGFFRDCKKHENRRLYLEHLMDDYCKYVYTGEHGAECKTLLLEKLTKRENFEKFFCMGRGIDGYILSNKKVKNFKKFKKARDASFIGIETPFPDWFEDQLYPLAVYMCSSLVDYGYNKSLTKNQFHTYSADRMISTKIFADLIGMPDIIPCTKYVQLQIDKSIRLGVSTDVAKGIDPGKLPKANIFITPNFQREILMLNILDVLCHQIDRGEGNYFVTLNEDGDIDRLSAFDNDHVDTFMPTLDIAFKMYCGDAPLVTFNGFVNRPFLDRESTETLLRLTTREIKNALRGNLTALELWALCVRVKRLQKAIRKSLDAGTLKLLDKDEWSPQTIQEELSGRHGQTYLKYFADKYSVSWRIS